MQYSRYNSVQYYKIRNNEIIFKSIANVEFILHPPGFSDFIIELEDMDPPPTAGFFGFRFLVWIPSFFMEIGLFT